MFDVSVLPPKSKTTTFMSLSDLSTPYANAAAVGSLIIRKHSMPAIVAAFLVALRCTSLNYAGTVTTHCLTSVPK